MSDEEMDDIGGLEDIEEKLAAIKIQLSEDPTNYDLNLELIKLLRCNGDLEELEEAREKLLQKYPLPAEEWINYINDYKAMENDREKVSSLFHRALDDCPCSQLWIEYVLWGCGDPKTARSRFEEAVEAIGLRADVGGQVWTSWLDLEDALHEEKELLSIYSRALRVPSVDLGYIWQRYEQFVGEDKIDPVLKKSHDESSKIIDEIGKYEMKVVDGDYSLEAFNEYLEWELNRGDPSRIQSFFERIIEKYQFDETIWKRYVDYLETQLKIPSVTMRVLRRAIRCCPESYELWQPMLLALERADVLDELPTLWKSARDNIRSADEGRALYRTYIYLLRRVADKTTEKDYSKVKEVFEEGAKILPEYFGKQWDPQGEYRRNQAWFYFHKMHDVQAGRRVMEDILASGGGRFAEKWLDAIRLERQFGDAITARKMFYKAVNSVSDHPGNVFSAFIQFEREEGTIDDMDKAIEKVNSQISRRGETAPKEEKKEERKGKRPRKEQNGEGEVKETRKRPPTKEKEEVPMKKEKKVDKDGFTMPGLPVRSPKEQSKPSVSDNHSTPTPSSADTPDDKKYTVFVSNLDFKVTPDKIMEVLDGVIEVRLVYRGMSKLHKGFGYVDLRNEEAVREALAKDRTPIDGRPMLVSEYRVEADKRGQFRYNTGLEKNKLFIKNVHYDATADQLKELFKQFGAVRDVRLVTHKSGKAKGVAYVEMEDEEAAKRAIEAEDVVLLERKLTVLLSNPPKKTEAPIQQQREPPTNDGIRRGHSSMISLVPRVVSRRDDSSVPSKQPLSNNQFRQFFK